MEATAKRLQFRFKKLPNTSSLASLGTTRHFSEHHGKPYNGRRASPKREPAFDLAHTRTGIQKHAQDTPITKQLQE